MRMQVDFYNQLLQVSDFGLTFAVVHAGWPPRPRRRPGIRPSPLCKRSILYRLRSADGRTLAGTEPPSQADRAFRPTCIAEPTRTSVALAPKQVGRRERYARAISRSGIQVRHNHGRMSLCVGGRGLLPWPRLISSTREERFTSTDARSAGSRLVKVACRVRLNVQKSRRSRNVVETTVPSRGWPGSDTPRAAWCS
jgi:hypothetical protein